MRRLTEAEIAALFAPLAGQRALLAVSGGPDSVALMRLAAKWLAEGGASTGAMFFVATVDHGLRAESRAEAEATARWAEALALPHQILIWQGAKPRSRIQERARAARYALLHGHARTLGAGYLLTAHHADDQAETILFRLMRGSGIAGLSGMLSMIKQDDVVLYRPLLNIPKKALVDYCEASAQPYVRDPSNENFAFARTWLRALLPPLDEAGLDAAGWARLGRRAARAEQALAAMAAQASAKLEKIPLNDGFYSRVAALRDMPEEILRRVIGAEIAALGSGGPLRLERLESLAQDLCAAMAAGAIWHRTLGGVNLSVGADGFLTLRREKPRRRRLETAAAGAGNWPAGTAML
jgi:tRNA(Ile)-lysidine synthase